MKTATAKICPTVTNLSDGHEVGEPENACIQGEAACEVGLLK
jgi:hypothetical protein